VNPDDAKALEGLLELPLPEPVSYTPETVGWYVLAAIVLFAVLLLSWRWIRYRAANRYRREALAELATLERAIQNGGDNAAMGQLPVLVKRTALAVVPRERVAALSGEEWLQFLDTTYGGKGFTTGPGRLLPQVAYGADAVSDEDLQRLLMTVKTWIGRHRAPV
jgi:uncharacterized protein DUF4381